MTMICNFIYMVYFRTKCQIPSSIFSLVIAVKLKAEEKFRTGRDFALKQYLNNDH